MQKYFLFFVIFINIKSNDLNFHRATIEMLENYKKKLEKCDNIKNPKAKERCQKKALIMTLLSNNLKQDNNADDKNSTALNINQLTELKKQNENFDNLIKLINNNKKANDKNLLPQVSNLLKNIGKVIVDPHDPANISNGILSVIGEILNIANTITRNKIVFENQDVNTIMNNMDDHTKKELFDLFYNEALKIHKRYIRNFKK